MKLEEVLLPLRELSVSVYGVSADSPETAGAMRQKLGFSVPLLCDPDLDTIRRLGLLHERGGPGGKDIARPAQILMNRRGEILWTYLSPRSDIRLEPEEVLAKVQSALAGKPPRSSK